VKKAVAAKAYDENKSTDIAIKYFFIPFFLFK